jgi:hypothetical protein
MLRAERNPGGPVTAEVLTSELGSAEGATFKMAFSKKALSHFIEELPDLLPEPMGGNYLDFGRRLAEGWYLTKERTDPKYTAVYSVCFFIWDYYEEEELRSEDGHTFFGAVQQDIPVEAPGAVMKNFHDEPSVTLDINLKARDALLEKLRTMSETGEGFEVSLKMLPETSPARTLKMTKGMTSWWRRRAGRETPDVYYAYDQTITKIHTLSFSILSD